MTFDLCLSTFDMRLPLCAVVIVLVVIIFGSVARGRTRYLLVPRSPCNEVTIYGLKTADCMNQNLVTVPRDLDADLKTFNLHNNLLKSLEIDSFAAYPSLQNLYLVRNELELIAPDAFRTLRNLQILDLEGNKLKSVPGSAFQHLPSLRFLSLKSNGIAYITATDLAHLGNVEVLNLENCWLNRIEGRALAGLGRIYELNLVNNELRGLSAEVEQTMASSLAVLRLHSNPWHCDCRLRWLRRTVDRVPNWDFGPGATPTCAGPDLLRGVTWRQLGADQFACPSTIVAGANATTMRHLATGANATVECLVAGDPQPQVTWLKGSRHVGDRHVTQHVVVPPDYRSASDGTLVRSVMTLRDVTEADSGDYRCVAVNAAGRSEVSYKIWVGGGGWTGRPGVVEAAGQAVWISLAPEVVLGMVIGGGAVVCVFLLCVVMMIVIRQRTSGGGTGGVGAIRKPEVDLLDKVPVSDDLFPEVGGCSPTGSCYSSTSAGSVLSTDAETETVPPPGENQQHRDHTWTQSNNSNGTGGRYSDVVKHRPETGAVSMNGPHSNNNSAQKKHVPKTTEPLCSIPEPPESPPGRRSVVGSNGSTLDRSWRRPIQSGNPEIRKVLLTDSEASTAEAFRIRQGASRPTPTHSGAGGGDGGEGVGGRWTGISEMEESLRQATDLNQLERRRPFVEILRSSVPRPSDPVRIKHGQSSCDNPLCLRERLPNYSPGVVAAVPVNAPCRKEGGSPVASKSILIKRGCVKPQRTLTVCQENGRESSSSRAAPGRDGVSFDPKGPSYPDAGAHATVSSAAVWNARDGDSRHRNRDGTPSIRSVRWRSETTTRLEKPTEDEEVEDEEEGQKEVLPLRRRQTFSSISLYETPSQPFGDGAGGGDATKNHRQEPRYATIRPNKGRKNAEHELCTTAV